MSGHAVEEQHVTRFERPAGPSVGEWVGNGQTSGTERGTEFVDAVLVRTGGDLQSTHVGRQIVQWEPGGIGLGCALDGNEVLVLQGVEFG